MMNAMFPTKSAAPFAAIASNPDQRKKETFTASLLDQLSERIKTLIVDLAGQLNEDQYDEILEVVLLQCSDQEYSALTQAGLGRGVQVSFATLSFSCNSPAQAKQNAFARLIKSCVDEHNQKKAVWTDMIASRIASSGNGFLWIHKGESSGSKKNWIYELLASSKEIYSVQIAGHIDCVKLSRALMTNMTLTSLRLCDNDIDDKGVKVIMESLIGNRLLTRLSFGKNKITALGAIYIAANLKYTHIKTLILEDNKIGLQGATAIVDAVKQLPILEGLGLAHAEIGLAGCELIAHALKNATVNINIRELHVQGNNIGDKGAQLVADLLETCPNLKVLKLGDNHISSHGFKVIAAALEKKQTLLNHLDISCNPRSYKDDLHAQSTPQNIRDSEGVIAVLKAIKTHPIITLDIEYTNLDDHGAALIADMLMNNPTVKWLSLRSNLIGDQGAELIAKVLPGNTNLIYLNLWGNNFGDKTAKLIISALMDNKTLMELSIDNNTLKDMGNNVVEIQQYLNRNKNWNSAYLGFSLLQSLEPSYWLPAEVNLQVLAHMDVNTLRNISKV